MKVWDVVIIGGGIIGLASAFQIARRSPLKVLVLEKGAGLGEGSTGASSAVLRHRYTRDEMVYLSRDGINAYRNWAEFTGLQQPRARFEADGVLWLPGAETQWAQREHNRLTSLGIATQTLSDADLRRRFPALSGCTIAPDLVSGEPHNCRGGGQHLFEIDGGHTDPVAAAEDLLEASRRLGVEIRLGTRVSEICLAGGVIRGVRTADGSNIDAPVVINANGPWVDQTLAAFEFSWPWKLVPVRAQVLYLDKPAEVPGRIPVCVDMSGGIYFRQQNRGAQLVVGSVREEDEREVVENPDALERLPDESFTQATLHALHHRIPELPYRGRVRGYCGMYTVNLEDVHPIVGRTPVDGLLVANGFSGHGFKIAPAVGSLLAQMVTGERCEFDTNVAPEFLAPDRAPLLVDEKSVLA